MILLFLFALDDPQMAPAQVAARKVELEKQVSAAVRGAISPICLGRCELLGVDIEMGVTKQTTEEMPGFERVARSSVDATAKSIVVHIAADQKLTPATRQGLAQAVKASIVGLAPTIDVQVKPFDFPQPRNEAASPIVISMTRDEKSAPAAPASLPAAPPPPPPTPLERLLGALADGAPWLIGLLIVFMGVGFLLWLRSRLAGARVEQGSRPDGAVAEQAGLEGAHEKEVGTSEASPSPLIARCGRNRALRAAVTRRVLEDPSAWPCLTLLGAVAIDEFHESDLAVTLPAAYALLREKGKRDAPIAELEMYVAEELELGEPDERLWALWTIDATVFSAIVRAMDADGALLLMLAPGHLRRAHLQGLSLAERQAFYAAALDLRTPLDVEALAKKLERELKEKRAGYHAARRATASLGEEGDEQARMLQALIQKKPYWSGVAEAHVVSEQQILAASDEVLDALLYQAPPEALVTFLRGAGPELKLKVQGRLPAYLKALQHDEQQRDISDEQMQRARAAVFRAFRTLRRPAPQGATSVKVAK